jgi:lipid A ethanolaminephosphotransferase
MDRLIKCTTPVFCLIIALFYALVLNSPFIIKAWVYIYSGDATYSTLTLLLTFPLFLFCIFFSLFSLLSFPYIEKPILIILTIISSVLSYAYAYHGVAFDDSSPMIGTIEQTDWEEISPLITPSFIIWFLILGVAPSYWIFKVKIIRGNVRRELLHKGLSVLAYPLFYFLIVLPFLSIFSPVVYLSGLSARAPFQIIPTNFFENAFKHYQEKFTSQFPYVQLGLDAKNIRIPLNDKKNILIIVIGEAARGMNFSYNGYPRQTTPFTEKQNLVSFTQVTSCGTSTRVSVPCIFSNLTRDQFSILKASHQDNLLDILKRAGLNLFWFDNNGAGDCQGVCKQVGSMVTHCLDGELIPLLAEKMNELQGKDALIVVHLQGSHGPSYYAKYPKQFRKFTPDCRKNELRLCDKQSLLNAYDNSILYTDFVVNEMIELLKSQSHLWNGALIYTSDHGESIGERGLYGHCAPYLFAPMEQKHVPLLVWFSPAFEEEKTISASCLKTKASREQLSHDNLFHSILGIMDIKTNVYDEKMDLFQSCRPSSPSI